MIKTRQSICPQKYYSFSASSVKSGTKTRAGLRTAFQDQQETWNTKQNQKQLSPQPLHLPQTNSPPSSFPFYPITVMDIPSPFLQTSSQSLMMDRSNINSNYGKITFFFIYVYHLLTETVGTWQQPENRPQQNTHPQISDRFPTFWLMEKFLLS